MIFEEKEPGLTLAILAPLLAFAIIFPVWHLGERDLYWAEGEYAAAAHEMSSFPPVATAHGELVPDIYPLFPFFVSNLHKLTGWSSEFCLRLISVLSLAGLGAVVWESCRRALGLQAAIAGCAMMISTVLVAEKAIDGYPHLLALFLMTCGWLLWFTFGQSRGNWDAAWCFAGLFAGLSFYCNGWESLLYFTVPLLFMRRPLSIWGRLNRPGLYAGLALLLLFILLWAAPRWRPGLGHPFGSTLPIESDISLGDYLEQLVIFPFEVALRFMPWTILIWIPFCSAIIPLDRNPLFSRFLRTIFVTLFVMLWIMPTTHGRDILILAPSISMLVAMHYWLAARRHGDTFLRLIKWASIGIGIAALVALTFYLLPIERLRDFISIGRDLSYKTDHACMIRGVVESSCSIAAVLFTLYLCKRRAPVWAALLALFVAGSLVFWAAGNPYKASERSRSEMGKMLRDALGPAASPNLVVYKDISLSGIRGGLFAECEYMDCNIKRLNSVSELPPQQKEVFVIASEVPSVPERVWTNLLPEKRYNGKRICLWRGVLKEDNRRNDVNR